MVWCSGDEGEVERWCDDEENTQKCILVHLFAHILEFGMTNYTRVFSRTDTTNRSVWHMNPTIESVGGGESEESRPEGLTVKEGSVRDFAEATATQSHNLMITAATRVWEELYITKKPAIEEVS